MTKTEKFVNDYQATWAVRRCATCLEQRAVAIDTERYNVHVESLLALHKAHTCPKIKRDGKVTLSWVWPCD